MPKISDMMERNYLSKKDVNGEVGILVTIHGVAQANVAIEGDEPKLKWTVLFNELDKPLVANTTNLQLIAKACGSEDTDDWIGKKIVLYEDPNVTFGGQLVGGIRVRTPRTQVEPKVPTKPKKAGNGEDVPF